MTTQHLKPAGDHQVIVKLFENFRDRYAEQHERMQLDDERWLTNNDLKELTLFGITDF